MVIKLKDKCYGRELLIDEEVFSSLEETQQNDVIQKLVNSLDKEELIKCIIETYGHAEFRDEPRDQCGHYYSEYTLELK